MKIRPSELPDFSDDMSYSSLKTAVGRSLDYLTRLHPSTPFRFGPDTYLASHLSKSMRTFLEVVEDNACPDALKKAIETSFFVYRSAGSDGSGKVLFTGYYEPTLGGSLKPSSNYPYPVYRRPDDLVSVNLGLFNPKYGEDRIVGRYVDKTVIPYFSREDIDAKGRLLNKGSELLWVSDQIDLFFLHIQGSGRVLLEDGTVLHINYDCSNGRPYRSVGRLLIDEGRISREEISMQQIRAYMRNHPDDTHRVFNHNERYVFFRLVDEGPLGALEVPLTPGRSVATDMGLFPRAALAFVEAKKPLVAEEGVIRSWKPFGRFVLSQDTGEAICGVDRVDLFWGSGSHAETAAGHMKCEGTLYFLVLKKAGEE